MKCFFTIIVIILFSTFGYAQNSIWLSSTNNNRSTSNERFEGFQCDFSFEKIDATLIKGTPKGVFSALSIDGAYSDGDFGTPALPVFREMIAVPAGATPKLIIKNYTVIEYHLNDYGIHAVMPMQPDVRKDQKPEDIPFAYKETSYTVNEFSRDAIAEIGVIGKMREMTIGMLVVHPVKYNPTTHSILVYNNVELEVVFENADYNKTQETYRNAFSPMFLNPNKTMFNRGVYEEHPDLYNLPVRMLVIANRMFEETLQPWIEWKTKKGIYMDVNYTDEIGTSAGAIKTFCHQKYNEGIGNGTAPTFIVLVGDIQQVPASQTGSYTSRATDLYYGCVDNDYFPDIYYSRLSAQTTQQLANQLEKIIFYEQYQFEDPSFLDNVLLIAGADATWNPRLAQPTINYAANYYYNTSNGYSNIYKYLNSYSGCYTNLNNIGFANYTAHGGENCWADPPLSISMVNALTNSHKYFIAIGNCCVSGDFGYDECLGEAMLRAENKAAVGYIGSSPNSYWADDFYFGVGAYSGNINTIATPTLENTTDGYYDLAFRDADFNCLSSHVFAGNLAVTYAHVNPGYTVHTSSPWYYWEAYNLLGDGSLMPYNTQGQYNTVSHLPVIPLGVNAFEVHATSGSYVAISKDGVLLGVAVANASGIANVSFQTPITTVGQVDLVVTRNQYKPYIEQITIAPLDGAYVTYDGFNLATETALTYMSENSEIDVTIKNIGNVATSSNLSVSFSCSDPQLTINNPTISCNGIESGAYATIKLSVSISHDICDNKSFPVKITVTAGSQTWESILPLIAYAPNLKLEKVIINNIENGYLESSNIAVIKTNIVNVGHATAYNITGRLNLTDNYIVDACNTTEQSSYTITEGKNASYEFFVFCNPSIPDGYKAEVSLIIEGDYDLEKDFTFNVSTANYCMPDNTGCDDNDKFLYVALGEIENTDITCFENGYSDYTNMSTTLIPGQQYELKVKVGYANNNVKGWIDFNGNKIFENNEVVANLVCNSTNEFYTQTFTVPETATPGQHQLRLRTQYNAAPEICNGFTYGQTHDYSIIIPEVTPRVSNVVAYQENISTIKLSWDVSETSTSIGYNIYRNGLLITGAPVTNNFYEDTNLTEDIYVYMITALFAQGKESMPETSNIVCFIKTCKTVINPQGTVDKDVVFITWEDPETVQGNILGYNVYRDGIKLNETLLTTKQYKDIGLSNGIYTYHITAYYEHCQETESSLAVVVTILESNISILDVEPCQIFPNPATKSVAVTGKNIVSIEIYDLTGRKLSSYHNINNSFTIENLEIYQSGMYLVKIITDVQTITKRLAIIH